MRSHVFAPRSARQNARAEALVTPAWVTAVPVPSSLQPCIVPIKPRWVVAASPCPFSACYSRSAKTHTGTSLQQGFPVSAFWGLGVPRKWLTRSGSGRNRCACWCGHNCRLRWHELSEGGQWVSAPRVTGFSVPRTTHGARRGSHRLRGPPKDFLPAAGQWHSHRAPCGSSAPSSLPACSPASGPHHLVSLLS